MKIFCDESGGEADGCFLVASVSVDGISARRFIKDFRKATSITSSEIKGAALTIEQRAIFLSLFIARNLKASCVVCRRSDPIGGWAFHNFPESILWSELVAESSGLIIGDDAVSVHVLPDSGRYTHFIRHKRERAIEAKLAETHRLNDVRVGCRASHEVAGIQIADVIANTIWRALSNVETPDRGRYRTAVNALASDCVLRIEPLSLAKSRPEWLAPQPIDFADKN